ncbi:hypothetical protein DMC61_03630 [Amycolatopsis sp. WAC 04169]|uniref:DUF6339 family protein n=1 Tax=Amycolatopsis sp. WAC 04169 TaxID=2203197 RepID=UPI000F787C0B|nr:DUF6339 family protein [Amycolatopsis sp. WAC 04169]RSN37161.1 hypothetical protein DMC61_03630 [Amycolatopsis sp. WAC 04169]
MKTSEVGIDIPEVMGSLPNAVVARHLTAGILSGHEALPRLTLRKAAVPLSEDEMRWRTAPIRALADEAMRRFQELRTPRARAAADGWFAPRLHATLRMTRAEAADPGLWNFLALIVAPDYVIWRHKGVKGTAASRFSGRHYDQSFARLWWAAELFRNGRDYRTVELACRAQDVLNSTMRLDVIDHRPTALAFIKVLQPMLIERSSGHSDLVNALSPAVNAAGSTLLYDVLAPDEPTDDDALRLWIEESAEVPAVHWDRLPAGPDDGAVSDAAIARLTPLFEQLLTEAPKRKRPKKAKSIDE